MINGIIILKPEYQHLRDELVEDLKKYNIEIKEEKQITLDLSFVQDMYSILQNEYD
jgi:hypothetical protein